MVHEKLQNLMVAGLRACLALLLLLAGAASALAEDADAPVVGIETGPVQGFRQGPVDVFLGLPYAATTAGASRWRAPQPAEPKASVRDATRFGADCQQDPPYVPPGGSPWSDEFFPDGPMSEDCLFLNVWAPADPSPSGAPVLVWIHGGGFAGGSGAIPIYHGQHLAARGLVVVTINYRVSVFGFLAHPELTAEAGSSGNYGLQDQIAALRWVQRNIGAFGGDPARVTIAGQSAGAASVHALIASPLAKGLFVRAIAQSGSGMGIPIGGLQEAEALGVKVAASARVTSIAELRALPVERVVAAARDPAIAPPGLRYRPIREPVVYPDPDRPESEVAVLTGLTGDEASASPDWGTSGVNEWQALLSKLFGAHAGTMNSLYPVQDADEVRPALHALLRDRGIAGMLNWAQGRADAAVPTFGYVFVHAPPGPDAESDPARFGAFHSAEIPYVFGTLEAGERTYGPDDRRLSEAMMAYWVNFVRTGNPNGPGMRQWPDIRTGEVLWFADPVSPRPALSLEKGAAFRAYLGDSGRVGIFP